MLQEHTEAAEARQAGAAVPAAAPRYPVPGTRDELEYGTSRGDNRSGKIKG